MKASLRMPPPANDNGVRLRVVCPVCSKHVRPGFTGRFMHRNAQGEPCRGARNRRMRPNGTVLTWQRLLEHAKRGGALTPREVARAFTCKAPYASHRLMYHARRGRLQRIAHGRFALPGNKASYARAMQSSGRLLPLWQGLTMRQWSERSGVPYDRILARLRYGWPVDRAVREPCAHRAVVYKGLTLSQWATSSGIPLTTIRDRVKRGWPIGRAVSEPRRRAGAPKVKASYAVERSKCRSA